MVEQVRILIVDDKPRARQSLRALLASYPEVAEIQEAKNGLEGLRRIGEYSPDIVFMDLQLPDVDGNVATRLVKRVAPRVKVIAMSVDFVESEALAAGADAFVCRGEPLTKLLETLAQVIAESPAKEPK